MTNFKTITKAVIKAAGGDQAVADTLKRTRQAVNMWTKVPPHHVNAVAKLSGWSPAQIRPDIFAEGG